jgi:hypothetical protein
MSQHPIRPENRSRGASTGADWADTLPACFRSEGFAEDLHESESADPAQHGVAPERREWVARTALALRSVAPAWGLFLAGWLGPVSR